MRATSLGQAGDAHRDGPRLDRLRPVVRAGLLRVVVRLPRATTSSATSCSKKIRTARTSTSPHLHGDHFDETWLAGEGNIRRDIARARARLPGNELDGRLRALGFDNLIRTTDGEEHLGGAGSDGGGDPRGGVDHRRPGR